MGFWIGTTEFYFRQNSIIVMINVFLLNTLKEIKTIFRIFKSFWNDVINIFKSI